MFKKQKNKADRPHTPKKKKKKVVTKHLISPISQQNPT